MNPEYPERRDSLVITAMEVEEEIEAPPFRLELLPDELLQECLASCDRIGTAEENLVPASLLDLIPTELLDNVLRFLSSIQNSNKWETHIDLNDLMELFTVHHELGIFLKSRFHTLIVTATKDCESLQGWLQWNARSGPHLWTDSIDIAHKYIMKGGGQSLETLVISPFDEVGRRKRLADDFVKNCPNVKSLSISEKGAYWVKKFGRQIHKLEVSTQMPLELPQHLPSLRELTLKLPDHMLLPGFWQSIGGGLEKLCVFPFQAKEEAGEIRKHCRRLKSIYLGDGDDDDITATVPLLTSYGDQLEYAFLCGMNEGQVKEVVNACPKARFDVEDFVGRFTSTGIDLIGPKLNYMSTSDFTVGDRDEWTYVWNKCSNLLRLYIHMDRVEDIEEVKSIFSTPKQELKDLRVIFGDEIHAENVQKAMKVCAEGTKCIEKLIYYGPEFYGDGPKKFLDTNRATLKYISLGRIHYAADEKLDKLLDSFLELPALEILYINCMIPGDKLKSLRERGIYWKSDMDTPDMVAGY